jgi:hypothetical protein
MYFMDILWMFGLVKEDFAGLTCSGMDGLDGLQNNPTYPDSNYVFLLLQIPFRILKAYFGLMYMYSIFGDISIIFCL